MKAEEIKEVIEKVFCIDDLSKRTRKVVYICARSVLFYHLRNKKGFTLQYIGNLYGLSHATVINSINRFEGFKHYRPFKREIKECCDLIENNHKNNPSKN